MKLRTKLAIAFTAVIIIITGSIAILSVHRETIFIKGELQKQGLILANTLADECAEAFIIDKFVHVMDYIDTVLKQEYVVYAMVRDKNGKVRAHSEMHRIGEVITDSALRVIRDGRPFIGTAQAGVGRKMYEIAVPVTVRGNLAGMAQIGYSLASAEISMAKAKKQIIVITIGGVIVGILLAFILSRQLVKPITKLKDGANGIARGNFNTKLEVKLKDEIGELASAFNKMTIHLKTSRDELVRAKDYTDDIIKSMIEALIVVDSKNRINRLNEAALNLLGYTEAELIEQPLEKVFPEHEMSKTKPEELIKKTGSENYETYYKTKNGKKVPVLLGAAGMLDQNGKVKGIIFTATDITERKQSREEILRKNALLDAINEVFQETLTCESDKDVARTCLAVAEKLTESKFGFIGEVNQTGRFDTIAQSDTGWKACKIPKSDAVVMIRDMEIRGIWSRVIEDERSIIVNQPASHPDSVGTPAGHPAITCFLGVPLKDANKTIGMISLANKESGYDLADQQAVESLSVAFMEALNRKRAEEALRQEKEFVESIVENAQTIVLVLDKEGRIVRFNPYMEQISGYKTEEVQGKDWFSTFLPESDRSRIRKLFKQAVGDIQTRGNVNSIITKDGQERQIEWYDKTLRNAAGTVVGVLAIGQDITEQKRLQDSLLKSQGQLRSLSANFQAAQEQERKRLSRELHDDLGQLLTAILFDIAQLKKPGIVFTSSTKGILERIQDETEKALQRVRSLSSVLRPDVLDHLGLKAAIESFLEETRERTAMNIVEEIEVSDRGISEPVTIAVYRILQEAMTNIVKHAAAKQVIVKLRSNHKTITMSIKDDGQGFNPESSPMDKGLGLLGIKERVEWLGGVLRVESAPGQGTTIYIEIPLSPEKLAI